MADTATWDILDRRTIDDLRADGAPERILGAMMSDEPTPEDRARRMTELAVAGNVQKLRVETHDFQTWAENHGLRRLVNALVELDRVLALPERGQAILQAQALTRHIQRTLDGDIAAFKRAITSG
ncbi:MAG: hypothetical protein ACFE0S_01835 [Rhodospirillales bacterium]